MFYKRRELMRLFQLDVFEGDREDPDCPTKKETIIAWNAVDAIRRSGDKAATQPVALHYVTHPEPGDPEELVYRIDSTEEGPVGEPIAPSVALQKIKDEEWQ